MSGRKYRGRSCYRSRGFDRVSASGGAVGGRGRGSGREGRGRSVINGDDFVHDVIPSHPRNRCPTVKEHVANVTNLNNLEDYLRPQTPARRTIISRGNSFPYGPGWLGGHMCATTSRPKERARMRPLDSKVRNGKASLSQLLYQDRPLLRPIVFVRSEFTPSLFLDEEEIFKPVAEADANHVPTAERVFQIFRHDEERPDLSSDSPSDAEELLEIDFTDLGRVMSEVEALEAVASPTKKAIESSVNNINNQRLRTIGVGVYTNARPSPEGDSSSPVGHIPETRILGEDMDEDDEIIVYVAPHPRNGKLASNLNQSPESFEAIIHHSLADRGPATMRIQHRTYTPPQHTESPAEPISERILATSPSLTSTGFGGVSSLAPFGSSKFIRNSLYPHHDSRRRSQQHATFGSFGAIQAEVVLQEVDLRKDEQRRGDPDVHWGGSTSEESVEGSGMLEDQDIDVYAMQAFVNGMTAAGIAHVSVDDLNDKTKIRAEDEDMETESGAKSDGSSDKDDAQSKLAGDEQDGLALGGALFESEDESTSPSDEGEIPNELFQARLELLRKRMQERPIKDVLEEELDQELEVDEEDGIITTTGSSLDDNDRILHAQGRKKNRISSIHRSKSEIESNFADIPARPEKKKDIPDDLDDQWERDRVKKAERKHLRQLERSAAALDLSGAKKANKKARKARLTASLVAPVTLEKVVEQMRRFVADIGGVNTLSLLPMSKEMRKSVHELAQVFGLRSKSRGKDATRFTILTRTALSGVMVDEKRIGRILGKYKTQGGGKERSKAIRTRPRDGEVVGETAPKLDESNIGFQLLSAMGWEQGSRIGVVGGLEAPLVAVIKTTKLGLGATRG